MDFRRVSGMTLRGRLPPRLDGYPTVGRAQYAAHAEAANVDREAFAVEVRDEILRGRRLGDLAIQGTLQQGSELARERELRTAGHCLGVRA
jgi:hypothetical protein